MSQDFRPLRVRFNLETPMCAPVDPIHLDGLLAWAAVDEAGDFSAGDDLPLARHGPPGAHVFCASHIFPAVAHRGREVATRSHETQQWAIDQGVVFEGGPQKYPPGTGAHKAYQLVWTTWQAPVAIAWCIGDPARVACLLGRVRNLGKLGALDHGRIAKIDIIVDEAAHTYWRVRTMPDPAPGYWPRVATLRPPYWKRESRTQAWQPGSSLVNRCIGLASDDAHERSLLPRSREGSSARGSLQR